MNVTKKGDRAKVDWDAGESLDVSWRLGKLIQRRNLSFSQAERRNNDNITRSGSRLGQSITRLHSGGGRGPIKGPSKPGNNGPKGGTKEWKSLMGW